MSNHINFRTATDHRTTGPVRTTTKIDPAPAIHDNDNDNDNDVTPPRRSPLRWIAPVGLAVVLGGIGVVGLVAGNGDDNNDNTVIEGSVDSNVVVATETMAIAQATDTERPGDLVVSGWYTTRSFEPVIENTAAPVLQPVIIGEPVVEAGTASCIAFQALGPNADLAPDPTGQRSSGVEVLTDLRQRGPNAGLAADPAGQRSSGQDPICVAP